MVPKEPTKRIIIDGYESEPDETFIEPEVWEMGGISKVERV